MTLPLVLEPEPADVTSALVQHGQVSRRTAADVTWLVVHIGRILTGRENARRKSERRLRSAVPRQPTRLPSQRSAQFLEILGLYEQRPVRRDRHATRTDDRARPNPRSRLHRTTGLHVQQRSLELSNGHAEGCREKSKKKRKRANQRITSTYLLAMGTRRGRMGPGRFSDRVYLTRLARAVAHPIAAPSLDLTCSRVDRGWVISIPSHTAASTSPLRSNHSPRSRYCRNSRCSLRSTSRPPRIARTTSSLYGQDVWSSASLARGSTATPILTGYSSSSSAVMK